MAHKRLISTLTNNKTFLAISNKIISLVGTTLNHNKDNNQNNSKMPSVEIGSSIQIILHNSNSNINSNNNKSDKHNKLLK